MDPPKEGAQTKTWVKLSHELVITLHFTKESLYTLFLTQRNRFVKSSSQTVILWQLENELVLELEV